MNNKLEIYKNILGIQGEISAEELKRIYRLRAKLIHPDNNPHPKSHDHFILLQEAYKFYEQYLNDEAQLEEIAVFTSKKYPQSYRTETWKVDQRVAARKRAAERAKNREAYFRQKGYYKRIDKIFFAIDVLRFIITLLLLFVCPIILFINEGVLGLIIVLLVQGMTYPLWIKALKRFISIKPN